MEKRSPKMARGKLLAAVRREVKRHGNRPLGFKVFLERSGYKSRDVYRNFGRWGEALTAAGYDGLRNSGKIPTEMLLEDYGEVCRKVGRVAVLGDYNVHGRFGTATHQTRFGGWSKVREAFRDFAVGKDGWADVVGMMEDELNRRDAERTGNVMAGDGAKRSFASQCVTKQSLVTRDLKESPVRRWVTGKERRKNAVIYGAPMDFGVLRHEPVNEQGVVFLFALMAERLEFLVEALRMGFPDCLAKRQSGKGEWESVRIEFEFESRNFLTHKHPAEGCDLIVCWKNNWAECPIEVLTLRDEIGRLIAETQRR